MVNKCSVPGCKSGYTKEAIMVIKCLFPASEPLPVAYVVHGFVQPQELTSNQRKMQGYILYISLTMTSS